MSGIAGIIHRHGQWVPEEKAHGLAASIRHRGWDGLSLWREANACLIHAHASTTGHRETNLDQIGDGPKIAGDIRLDNRESLWAALGLERPLADCADTGLVLAAWRRWGQDCCTHLIGDFAFAIWDPAAQTLFLARDTFGVKPLFYRVTASGITFASELAAVVPPGTAVNEARIAGYLLGIADDDAATAFAGAARLPAGHWLRFVDGELAIQSYGSLDAGDIDQRASEEQFRDRFTAAVSVRLRGPAPVGAMLSGGLDSSSIAATAAPLWRGQAGDALPVYSFDYPATPVLSERPYVDAVLARHAFAPVFLGLDDLHPADGLADLIGQRSDLFFAPGLPKLARVYGAAHAHGTRVILEGHGGDEVVSHGHGRLGELARSGNWLALYRELRGLSDLYGDSAPKLFVKLFTTVGPGRVLAPIIRRLRRPPPAQPGPVSILNPGFARSLGAGDRQHAWVSQYRAASRTEAGLHRWTLRSPAIAKGFETLDRAAARAGVELRYPFFDLSLVRYALSLPASEKLRDGWSRSILRRAMDGILPPKVQWRRDKIDFTSEITHGLARHHRDLLDETAADGSGIGRYVDLSRLRPLIATLKDSPSQVAGHDLFAVWRSLFLMIWLKAEGAR